MSKETILFQYINGESTGKIVSLKKIDDNNPLGEMYYFDDGMKCLKDMIGDWGDTGAYRSGKMLSRIPSKNNAWKFQNKEIVQNDKKGYDEEGKEYDIPDPYFIDKSGKVLHDKKIVKKIAPVAPVYRKGEFKEIPDSFYTSYVQIEEPVEKSEEFIKPVELKNVPLEEPSYLTQISSPEPKPSLENITSVTVNTDVKPWTFIDNMNSPAKWQNFQINIIQDNKIMDIAIPFRDIIEGYINFQNGESCFDDMGIQDGLNVSEPVRILVDSCKKKSQEIDMTLNIDLPGKSFYEMVSENYGEDKAKECIHYIIDNLDISLIKHSLKQALLKTYNLDNQE